VEDRSPRNRVRRLTVETEEEVTTGGIDNVNHGERYVHPRNVSVQVIHRIFHGLRARQRAEPIATRDLAAEYRTIPIVAVSFNLEYDWERTGCMLCKRERCVAGDSHEPSRLHWWVTEHEALRERVDGLGLHRRRINPGEPDSIGY
jgi:hypothetical protein